LQQIDSFYGLGLILSLKSDREFFPADAADELVFAKDLFQDSRRLTQHLIADLVPEAIIDLLEMIDVCEDENEGSGASLFDFTLELIEKARMVEKPGEAITLG